MLGPSLSRSSLQARHFKHNMQRMPMRFVRLFVTVENKRLVNLIAVAHYRANKNELTKTLTSFLQKNIFRVFKAAEFSRALLPSGTLA